MLTDEQKVVLVHVDLTRVDMELADVRVLTRQQMMPGVARDVERVVWRNVRVTSLSGAGRFTGNVLVFDAAVAIEGQICSISGVD
jgi:hypothetical protein